MQELWINWKRATGDGQMNIQKQRITTLDDRTTTLDHRTTTFNEIVRRLTDPRRRDTTVLPEGNRMGANYRSGLLERAFIYAHESFYVFY